MNASHRHTAEDLLIYLRMLAGNAEPGQFFDVRCATPAGGMRQQFVSALAIHETARLITRLGRRSDVYVGVALREGRGHGGKRAISGSHLLYIECDDPDAGERLDGFSCSPSMIVASGSPGHLHIYWCLRERASSAQVESANRRLALALRGDLASADIARMLRPPASMNHKHRPPVAVRLVAHDADVSHALAELTAGLPQDLRPAGAGPPGQRVGRTQLDRELLAIPATEYVRVLAGLEPNRAGKVLCPFHEETDPSLQLYPDGSFYCFGTGCGKGGTIFDFAAARWGTGTHRREFLELRRRLASAFAITPASTRRS